MKYYKCIIKVNACMLQDFTKNKKSKKKCYVSFVNFSQNKNNRVVFLFYLDGASGIWNPQTVFQSQFVRDPVLLENSKTKSVIVSYCKLNTTQKSIEVTSIERESSQQKTSLSVKGVTFAGCLTRTSISTTMVDFSSSQFIKTPHTVILSSHPGD